MNKKHRRCIVEYMTITEAADKLGVSPTVMRKVLVGGNFPVHKGKVKKSVVTMLERKSWSEV